MTISPFWANTDAYYQERRPPATPAVPVSAASPCRRCHKPNDSGFLQCLACRERLRGYCRKYRAKVRGVHPRPQKPRIPAMLAAGAQLHTVLLDLCATLTGERYQAAVRAVEAWERVMGGKG